jgi:hypothetical protein
MTDFLRFKKKKDFVVFFLVLVLYVIFLALFLYNFMQVNFCLASSESDLTFVSGVSSGVVGCGHKKACRLVVNSGDVETDFVVRKNFLSRLSGIKGKFVKIGYFDCWYCSQRNVQYLMVDGVDCISFGELQNSSYVFVVIFDAVFAFSIVILTFICVRIFRGVVNEH